jgi:hypothetical protein
MQPVESQFRLVRLYRIPNCLGQGFN